MQVFEIRGAFGQDNLQLGERPEPRPGVGEVLLRMHAASLNFRDLLMVRGQYNPRQPLPLIPCSDGVGEVVEIGEGVTRLQVGDRVATLFSQAWMGGEPQRSQLRSTLGGPLDGTLAEYVVLSENGVAPVPEHLSHVEAATLPCAALTAWSALATYGQTRAGQTVLVQGTGGVSLFALQLAQLLGARVIVTSSSDEKLEAARRLGSWREINYSDNPEWGKLARQITEGEGVNHIVEVGGAGTLAQSLKAIRVGGRISLIGVLSGHTSQLDILPILMQNVCIQGILVGSRDGFAAMCRAIDQHQLRPHVHRVFPFAETPRAFEHMAASRHVGKICIEIG